MLCELCWASELAFFTLPFWKKKKKVVVGHWVEMIKVIIIIIIMIVMIIIIIIIIIMSVFLECLSMCNMLSCAEQVQIQKYKTHAYKTIKTAVVQLIMKHPTKHKKEYP